MRPEFRRNIPVWILAVLLGSLLLMGCGKKKKDPEGEDPATVFDKKGLLVNQADNLIIPAYVSFSISFDSLRNAFQQFKLAPGPSQLQILRSRFSTAWMKYQRISILGFGPGEDQAIRINFNIFPCSEVEINNNISAGVYDLSTAANIDAKGFPALDYLFNGLASTEGEIITKLSQPGHIKYAEDLFSDMQVRLSAALTAWQGSYRESFINSLGTDVGSSLGFLVNQINYELDYLKNAKIATPLGLRSGGTPLPGHCEAYYSGQSMRYAIETLKAIENSYLGRGADGTNGPGFDDYLDHLGAQYNNDALTVAIASQFASCFARMQAVNDPLSAQVTGATDKVNAAYTELVKLLVLLKTDMPSNLGVVITYQDGDGD